MLCLIRIKINLQFPMTYRVNPEKKLPGRINNTTGRLILSNSLSSKYLELLNLKTAL